MIVGIVLAAGRSARLGRPKLLLALHGEPLIRHTVRRVLKSSLDEVIVVVGRHAEKITSAIADLPVRVVVNPDAALGQSTSVVAGLAALGEDEARATHQEASSLQKRVQAATFLLGDQPGVEPVVIDALIATWNETKAPIVAPRYTDGVGNPVLFDRRVFRELNELTGDTGARDVIRAYQASGDLALVLIDRPAPQDVDTEEDYAALKTTFLD